MKEFTGLCIGGPLDGKMLAATSERHNVLVGDGPQFTWNMSAPEPNRQAVKRLTYRHEGGLKAILGTDLWVLESQTVSEAVSVVFQAYAKGPTVSAEFKGPPIPRPVSEAIEMLAYAGRVGPGQHGRVEFSLGNDGRPDGVVLYGGQGK